MYVCINERAESLNNLNNILKTAQSQFSDYDICTNEFENTLLELSTALREHNKRFNDKFTYKLKKGKIYISSL